MSGGWFDAGGGYEKFAYTASYTDALLLIAARDDPGAYPALLPEARIRAAVDHQAVEPGAEGAVRAGRDRQRQREQHDPGRLQLLVPAAGRGPDEREPGRQPRPDRVLRQVPAGLRGGPARSAGQPRPGGPVRRRLRPGRAARREQRPGAGREPAEPGPRRVRDGQDDQRRADRHRVPARLLPGHRVEERHALGRRRDRPGRRGDRRAGRAAERGPGHRGPLGPGLHRAGAPRGRRHVQPLRQRRGRRGRAAAGHAAGVGRRAEPGDRARHAARRPGRPAAHRRGLGQGRPVRARHPARRLRRLTARVRPVHHRRAVPGVRRLEPVRLVRASSS